MLAIAAGGVRGRCVGHARPARRAAYEERYRAYCDFYPALIDVMHRLEADAGSLSGSPVVFAEH